ncbi:hypothetical protein VB773_22275 [Haloarculaceae archaeon H-GB2-1]|nr:hypothetical protein [Haloarculaceae archaeon H-GB1-1]MEA5389519.1 hypothetical protein [Haloarculaceae archaeon H-GB11]MEA5410027.1 hypothetical protein [Haloarculaceae archaeon H-GB2-1]
MTGSGELDVETALDVVSRRAAVIECLKDGPKYNRDVRDELDVSRSTVYKAVSELESLELVRRGNDGHELTVPGRLLFEEYRKFRDRLEVVARPSHVLAVLPADASVPYVLLDGAEVYSSDRHAPHRPVHEIERVVTEAAVVEGTGPVVLPSYVTLFAEQVVADELEAELVFERPAFDHLVSDYGDEYGEAFSSENLTLWTTDAELPYGLLVVTDPSPKVGVIVYDRGGELKGFVLNDSASAYEWGHAEWTRCRAAATRAQPDE